MKIVIDKNIPFAVSAFKSFGDVVALASNEYSPQTVHDADILIVRSEVKVTKHLLETSKVKFIGTATIGTDHIDLEYLKSRDIGFASAPGCNANSVAEYIVEVLLYLSCKFNSPLKGKILGVVGVGNVGSKVVKNAESLGMKVLQNDPPLHKKTGDSKFVSLDELMEADFITLHVPLTMSGEDYTHHLFDRKRLGLIKKNSVLINTSRGSIVETDALKNSLTKGLLKAAVLDVWEGEPNINSDLLKLVSIGTPHIAGYSLDGKVNATWMIHDAIAKYFGLKSEWSPAEENLPLPIAEINYQESSACIEDQIYEIVRKCYDLLADDQKLRGILSTPESDQGKYFRQLRANYPVRREFTNIIVHLSAKNQMLAKVLSTIGFQIRIKS
jgi:erythronate-4-phosphate dehydrogenase